MTRPPPAPWSWESHRKEAIRHWASLTPEERLDLLDELWHFLLGIEGAEERLERYLRAKPW